MAELKAVADAPPDPKIGSERRTSGVAFPYFNLEKSVEVAKKVHEAGGSCDRHQLAPLLGYSGVNNGSFLSRVTAAKTFGLITQLDDQIKITARGSEIVAPVSDDTKARAMVEAFLNVPLFKGVYDEWKGRALPPDVGIKNMFERQYSVVPDRAGPTVKVMMDSAESAGFFKTTPGERKLVMPILKASGASDGHKARDEQPRHMDEGHGGNGGGGGSGNGGGGGGGNNNTSQIPNAILGLFEKLPAPAPGALSPKRRERLIAALTANINHLYPDADDDT
jgi:hypothetical protein